MKTITKAESLLLDLFRARSAAKAEKARFAAAVEKRGGWRCVPDHSSEKESDWEKVPCWHRKDGNVCADCKILAPFHAAYRRASIKAGTALRRAIKEGENIFFDHH